MVIKKDTVYLSAQEIIALFAALDIDDEGDGKATVDMDDMEVTMYIRYTPIEKRSIMDTWGCSTMYEVETTGWENPRDIEIELSVCYDVADETLRLAQEIADKQFNYIEK